MVPWPPLPGARACWEGTYAIPSFFSLCWWRDRLFGVRVCMSVSVRVWLVCCGVWCETGGDNPTVTARALVWSYRVRVSAQVSARERAAVVHLSPCLTCLMRVDCRRVTRSVCVLCLSLSLLSGLGQLVARHALHVR